MAPRKPPAGDAPPAPAASSSDLDAIEVEVDDPLSVDRLLEITGESWSIDAQVETLKEATRGSKPPPLPAKANAKPASSAPDARRSVTKSAGPPPLPAAAMASAKARAAALLGPGSPAPPPLPSAAPPPVPSAAPPPVPSAAPPKAPPSLAGPVAPKGSVPPPLPAAAVGRLASAAPPPLPEAARAAPREGRRPRRPGSIPDLSHELTTLPIELTTLPVEPRAERERATLPIELTTLPIEPFEDRVTTLPVSSPPKVEVAPAPPSARPREHERPREEAGAARASVVVPHAPAAVAAEVPTLPIERAWAREAHGVRQEPRPAAPAAPKREPAKARPVPDYAKTLVQLLGARAAVLERAGDAVGLARVHLELAIVDETIGEEARTNAHAEEARRIAPRSTTAHGILRRRTFGKAELASMLAHLEAEISGATTEAASVELLAERARHLGADDRASHEARGAWEHILARSPVHAAALKGLESTLWEEAERLGDVSTYEALVAHLADLADAYASQHDLSAWLHVERGLLLERRLGRPRAARNAFERALAIDPAIGAVRSALVRHVAATGDFGSLAILLEEEAALETDRARASRLDLDAACIYREKLADDTRAIFLLERAAARVPTDDTVDRRILSELAEIYEEAGRLADTVRVRAVRSRYLREPSLVAHERKQTAELREKLGDYEGAVGDIHDAIHLDPDDTRLFDTQDHLLASLGRHEERVSMWLGRAAESEDAQKRTRSLARAAFVLERDLGRPDEAIQHLKAAWVATPGDPEVLEALSHLMGPTTAEPATGEIRKLVELYTQAAQTARDPGRQVAFLEKVALLWEELLGDPGRAARTYEKILDVEPERRGAILGLLRTARRLGDDHGLARALLAEAKRTELGTEALTLKVRAAEALARVDPARAVAVVDDVLAEDHAHAAGRALETRLHEAAGRWERVAESLRARIESATSVEDKVTLWLSLARVCDVRLGMPLEAEAALEAARKLDPVHPVPPVEIARVLRKAGKYESLRLALERLGDEGVGKEERARYFVRAAELDELRRGDDAGAAKLYARALAETPEDSHVADRLERVLARRALASAPARDHDDVAVDVDGLSPILDLLDARLQIAESREEQLTLSFDLGALLVECGKDGPRAARLLEAVLEAIPNHVPSLRLLELLARRTGALAPLSRVLAREGAVLTDARARAGALWNLAWLEEWRLPGTGTDTSRTYAMLLELDPTDASALEALVRRELGAARRGDAHARRAVDFCLDALCALCTEDEPLVALLLRLGLLVEAQAFETGDTLLFESALERFRTALELDPASVTAATSLSRLSAQLGDAAGSLAASLALADLETSPLARARHLTEAAEILLAIDPTESDHVGARLGPVEARAERAGGHLEAAIVADPNARAAIARLAEVRREQGQSERLVEVFFTALSRATEPESIVLLGTEIAKVARDELKELTLAIDAMRKVREAAPSSIPSLLMLAELCIAQRAWPEAVESLEDVYTRARDAAPRLTALFALASVFERVLSRPDDAENALRRALAVDPENARALRALVHRLVAKQTERGPSGEPPPRLPIRLEIATLLERLADVEPDAAKKTEIFLQLAEVRGSVKDARAAERAIIEALAHTPGHPRAEERFERFYRGHDEKLDAVGYARGLTALIGRGEALGRSDPTWYFRLGKVEAHELARLKDATVRLRQAIQLAPELHDARVVLASSLARLGAHDEAVSAVLAMITPSARPLAVATDASVALEVLERSLASDRRPEEAIVASELRALMGDLDEGRRGWLRARRLGPMGPHHVPLDRATLTAHVVPEAGRHVLLDVAAAVSGLEGRMLRSDLSDVHLTPKDRIGKRSGHPLRALTERLAKALGVGEVELAVSGAPSQGPRVRVLAQDLPWIVVPPSLLEASEPLQLTSLGRALARIALSIPWLEELPPPHVEAYLVACARQVLPSYAHARDEDAQKQKLVAQYEAAVAKDLSRKQRQALEKLVPVLSLPKAKLGPIESFVSALACAELRIAYLLTGDLLATVDELRALDPILQSSIDKPSRAALDAVLAHPYAGDVARFALGTEATALRRRVGATWAG